MIRIGTSGYSFDDWHGPFYPADLSRGKRLEFYAARFPVVEVNSTYYRIPHPAVFRRMEEKTPDRFRFFVKLNQAVTHKGRADADHFREFLVAISPLEEAGKLQGALAQFPWSFRRSGRNVAYLEHLRNRMEGRPLFVEFRHDSWAREETFGELEELGIGFCSVDEPRLRGLFPPIARATNGIGYVRFHGRNEANWWGRGAGDRYDYDYRDEELAEWIGLIRELESAAADTYIFFNNCHAGRAAGNAARMGELLGLGP